MDALLTMLIGFIQLVLGGMGVFVSLKPPQRKYHWYWIAAFLIVGLLGVGLTFNLARRASNAQEKANADIHKAQEAATSANNAATNANNAALAAGVEVKNARDEAKAAKDELSTLISKSSKETNTAVVLPAKTGHFS